MTKTPRDMTDDELRMLADAARSVYDTLDKTAHRFCRVNSLVGDEYVARALLSMYEAIAFGVIANNIAHEHHADVVNSLAGGLLARLKEFRREPRDFVKYDA